MLLDNIDSLHLLPCKKTLERKEVFFEHVVLSSAGQVFEKNLKYLHTAKQQAESITLDLHKKHITLKKYVRLMLIFTSTFKNLEKKYKYILN
jgi:hypothetical protein